MHLKDVVMIAANTSRSKAYAQILEKNDISLKGAVYFEKSGDAKPGQLGKVPQGSWDESPVFLPDLSVSVLSTLDEICDQVIRVSSDTINNSDILNAVVALSPEMAIYSGYGSQIVGMEILSSCPRILHLHAGWLPDFRGSTTTYYHLLKDGECAVSALLLEKEIDSGPIVARARYPKPRANLDIDHIYDGAIRADLLFKTMQHYARTGDFPCFIKQTKEEGMDYYIIHPVLKHIALLSLDSADY